MTTTPTPPATLSPSSQALWDQVLEDFELAPAELEVLRQALMSLERADQAAAIVATEGLTVLDRYGTPKQHPAADLERQSRTTFARLVAQLGVKLTDAPRSRR